MYIPLVPCPGLEGRGRFFLTSSNGQTPHVSRHFSPYSCCRGLRLRCSGTYNCQEKARRDEPQPQLSSHPYTIRESAVSLSAQNSRAEQSRAEQSRAEEGPAGSTKQTQLATASQFTAASLVEEQGCQVGRVRKKSQTKRLSAYILFNCTLSKKF